jgi:hypothetical protein
MFMLRLKIMATFVEMPSNMDIMNGPPSLQIKSIRRMREFSSVMFKYQYPHLDELFIRLLRKRS